MGMIDHYLKTLKETPPPSTPVKEEKLNVEELAEIINIRFPKKAFNESVYRKLLPLTLLATKAEQGEEDLALAKANAAKLTILFGDADKAIHYLKQYEKQKPPRRQLLHDACLFPLPAGENWKVKLWQALAIKHMPDKTLERILPFAEKVEAYVKDNAKELEEAMIREFELFLSQEYDQEEEAHTKMIIDKANNNFQGYIKQQLALPLTGKLTEEQIQQLRIKMDTLTDADKEIRKLLEKQERRSYEEKLAKMRGDISPNQTKQEYIEEQLVKRKKYYIQFNIDNLLSPRTTLATLLGYLKKLGYKREAENLEAAELFFENGLGEAEFEQYLELKPVDDATHIPDVGLIRTKSHPEFYLQKLDPRDPRAAILGKYTSCCQSLGGAGAASVIHSITDPRGGIYILCRQLSKEGPSKRDPIVAQCWVWRSKQNNLVFDSIESQINFRKKSPEIINGYFIKLADQLVRHYDVKRVLLGSAGATPKSLQYQRPVLTDQFVDYQGYSDAKNQTILADELFKLHSEMKDQPNGLSEAQKNLVKEWCAICVMNERSEGYLLPILTDLAPPGDEVRHLFELNKKFKQLLNLKKEEKGGGWDTGMFTMIRYVDVDFGEDQWAEAEKLIKQGANVNIPANTTGGEILLLNLACRAGRLDKVILLLESSASMDASGGQLSGLEEAVQASHAEVVQYLLSKIKNGKAPMSRKDGNTLLHLVKNTEIAKLVLSQIDDINATNTSGVTALHLAVKIPARKTKTRKKMEGDLPLVKLLIENHAQINVIDKTGRTPLYYSVANEDESVTEYLLQQKADANRPNSESGETPLHVAAKSGNLSLVKLLVKYGANVNTQNKSSKTPLDLASDEPFHKEVIKFLLENGANVDIKGSIDKVPLLHKVVEGNLDLDFVKFLLEDIVIDVDVRDAFNRTPLIAAVNKTKIKLAIYLLDLGADVNAADNGGNTALSAACYRGELDFIKFLVEERGADVHPRKTHPKNKSFCNLTLIDAAFAGQFEVIKYLHENNVDLNQKSIRGQTALIILCLGSWSQDHWNALKYLVQNGANLNIKDMHKNTALHHLAMHGLNMHESTKFVPETIAKLLLENGASLKIKNTDSNTPLLEAAKRGYLGLVKIFIEAGADMNFAGENLNTALHWAVTKGHLHVVQYLIEEANANMNLINAEGKSPAQIAEEKGDQSVIEYFNKLNATQKQQDVVTLAKIGTFPSSNDKVPSEPVKLMPPPKQKGSSSAGRS